MAPPATSARVVGLTIVRDERDVVVRSVRWTLAQGVDRVIAMDHGSRDGTRDLLADLERTEPVTVLDDDDPAYRQGARVTGLGRLAVERFGARWVVPFDADELWTLPRRWPSGGAPVLATGMLDHVATSRDDPEDDNPFTRLRWRRANAFYQKVLVRWRPSFEMLDGNHWVQERGRWLPVARPEGLALHHFPYRTPEQFHAKVVRGRRAILAQNVPLSPDQSIHWRTLGAIAEAEGPESSRAVFRERFFAEDPAVAGLVEDPVAWPEGLPAAGR